MNFELLLILYMKSHSKWIMGPYVKPKTIKFLEKNREHLCLVLGKDILGYQKPTNYEKKLIYEASSNQELLFFGRYC